MEKIRVRLDVPIPSLNRAIKEILSTITYFDKFEDIFVTTSYRIRFLEGKFEDNAIEIFINPEDERAKNTRLFKGFFSRLVFLIINRKEGLDEEIEQRLGIQEYMKKLKILLKNYFADKRAILYGCSSIFKDFYLELASREVYLNSSLTPLKYLELYTYYLNFKDSPFGNQLLELIEKARVDRKEELKALLLGFEELSYPNRIITDLVIKEWKRLKLWE